MHDATATKAPTTYLPRRNEDNTMSNKITTGNSDRSKDDTIAQSGFGLPDDSASPIEVSDVDVEKMRSKMMGDTGSADGKKPLKPA